MEEAVIFLREYCYTLEWDYSSFDATQIAKLRLAVDATMFFYLKKYKCLDFKAVEKGKLRAQHDEYYVSSM